MQTILLWIEFILGLISIQLTIIIYHFTNFLDKKIKNKKHKEVTNNGGEQETIEKEN